MQVLDLEGNTNEWKAKGVNIQKPRPRSKLHLRARNIVKERYPTAHVIEEVTVYVRPRQRLYLDLYIPLYKLAIEVHGEQHFKFNTHFHRDRMAFLKCLANDREKAEWCELNGITLVELNYNEDLDVWRSKFN